MLTPRRAIGLVIVAAGALLVVSQFIDYHGVRDRRQPGYAGLPESAPAADRRPADRRATPTPMCWSRSALIAVALGLAVICAAAARRRPALGAIVAGAASLAVILLIDLPHGLDVGAQSSRFAGASAVLEKGFSAELAAAGGWFWPDCSTMRGRA